LLGIGFILAAIFYGFDYAVLAGFFFTLPVLVILKKDDLFKHYILAAFFGVLWLLISFGSWKTNKEFISLGGFSLAPFFAWTMALFLGYLVYSSIYKKILSGKKFYSKLFIFFLMDYPITFIIANFTYIGLTICECIKSSAWLKVLLPVYVVLYFIAAYVIGLEKD
jgi:hypothetical protein